MQNGGGAAASTPPAVGSPQAPELLLEDDDDLDGECAGAQAAEGKSVRGGALRVLVITAWMVRQGLGTRHACIWPVAGASACCISCIVPSMVGNTGTMRSRHHMPCTAVLPAEAPAQPVLPQVPVTTSAAPPPGVNGGPLGVFMPQLVQQEQQTQQQPVSQPVSGLQALLGNPAMLSAAILGGAAASTSAPTSSAATGMSGNIIDAGMFGAGDMSGFGGFGQLPGTFSAGFGMSGGDQGAAGFADEGEDPYDPTLEG